MPEGRASKRKLKAAKRQAEAVELKIAGLSYDQIALRLGYAHRASAFRCIMSAMRELAERERESAVILRRVQLERYERLVETLWSGAVGDGVTAPHLHSLDRLVTVLKRIDRLLGLEQAKLGAEESLRIVEAFAKAGDREALDRVCEGEIPLLVALDRLPKKLLDA